MLITNFASGELSPNLNGRVDIQSYYQGASHIENFEIIPTGGIKRRPGTQRVAELGGNNRIIPFIVNKNFVFVLELGLNPSYDPNTQGSKPGLLNVWKKNALGVYEVLQTLYTSYTSLAEIKEVQYAQNYDTLIFVHKNYRPIELIRNAQGTFTLTDMEFNFIPKVELDDDFDYVMRAAVSLPTKVTTTGEGTKFSYYEEGGSTSELVYKVYAPGVKNFYCVLAGRFYQWNNTTSRWDLSGTDTDIDTELFTTATKYPSCVAFFNNRLFFASTILEPQKVWASAAPDSSGTRYKDFATYKKYITVNRTTKDADLHVFTCDISPNDVSGGKTTLRNVSQDFTSGLEQAITDYYITNNNIPIGTKVESVTTNTLVIKTADIIFPYDESTDPPTQLPLENVVCSIQLWRSSEVVSADDYDAFAVANNITTADCALFFELASDQNDAIKFLSSNRFLAVGTESSIWSVDPGITALNINAIMQGRYGSDDLQGQAVETATVYFAQGKKGIREFYYDGESNAFRTNNIALFADHLLRESAVIDFDYMTNPYSRLILVRADGTVAQMLYDKTNGIMAWSRMSNAGGKITNCAVTRGDDENDLIFFVVQLGEGENAEYFLELMDLNSQVFLDSWKIYDPTSFTPLDGYDADKAILYNETQDKICMANSIPRDFIGENDVVYIGYPITSNVKSMPVVNNDASGRRRIVSLQVRFVNSYLPLIKHENLPDELFTTVHQEPYSGVAKVNFPGVTDHDVYFELQASQPKPVNILSVDAITS